MNTFDFVVVPVIVTVVYTLISLLKRETKGNEKVLTRLPLIAAILGAILAVIGFYAVPDIVPTENLFTALLIGTGSGLAATGTHQVFKQMGAPKDPRGKGEDHGQDAHDQ
ncbi:MAG: phage holin family protein [Firmicutes bacterium]|nr:phage holin family protein [Bacillota bacterium]